MTRQFHQALRSISTRKTPARTAKTPNPNKLSFTCFRLIPIYDREPDEPAYASIELMDTQNAMRAFVQEPPRRIKRIKRAA